MAGHVSIKQQINPEQKIEIFPVELGQGCHTMSGPLNTPSQKFI
jgi:hypothetical protein